MPFQRIEPAAADTLPRCDFDGASFGRLAFNQAVPSVGHASDFQVVAAWVLVWRQCRQGPTVWLSGELDCTNVRGKVAADASSCRPSW